MNKEEILKKTEEHIRELFISEPTGHDWWHVFRVRNLAKKIAAVEGADLFEVEIIALLHDIADWKFYGGDEEVGPRRAKEWLEKFGIDQGLSGRVGLTIKQMSFKGAGTESKVETLEGKCVQDADRLDAMGAIGIARTFAFGGNRGRMMYNPEIKPRLNMTPEEYKNTARPTINHFYEKLLLLKDRMNTETGRRLAEGRHKYMEEYLDRFFKEWEGEI